MNSAGKRNSSLGNEQGQAAALVALLLFFVFLPFAALAIDGGMVYLMRRDLQNVADASALAACIDLANGGNTSTALDAATNTISTNLGSWSDFVGANPPGTNTGSGVSLIQGVEVYTNSVRVALQRPAPTILTQFLRRGQVPVTAQAHCGSTAGGGVLPIAVQRYDGRSPGATMVDHVAAAGAPIYPSDSITVAFWHNTQYDYDVMVPVPLPQWTASPSNPGPQFSLVGQSSESNNSPSSMNGLVSLDIRNVAAGTGLLEFYNGVTSGQSNIYKDVTALYLCQHGYPGPFPQIGSQIAQLMGVSASFGPGEMQDCIYRPGDEVTAIVYDGYVWTTPDFKVTLTPLTPDANGIRNPGYAGPGSPVRYSVSIAQDGPATWFNPLSFDLVFNLSEPVPADLHILLDGNPVTPGTPHRITNVFQATGWTGTLSVYQDSAGALITQTNRYLSGLNLVATSVAMGHTRGASSNLGYGALADYAVSSADSTTFVNQGSTQNLILKTYGAGQSCNNAPVHMEIVGGAWSDYFSSSQDTVVDIANGNFKSVKLALSARNTGLNDSTFTLRVTVGPKTVGGCNIGQHRLDIPLAILQPLGNQATVNQFVIIQGYVTIRIDSMSSNDVIGHVISPLYADLNSITVGLRPRLIPWN